MNETLLGELASVLHNSNINIRKPNISPITFDDQDRACITTASHVSVNYNNLAGKYNITILLCFSALDALLDYWISDLPVDRFANTLKALPKTSSIQTVISNTYRVMKTLRNGLVHRKFGINASASGVFFGEVNGNGKYVNLSRIGLDTLISIIFLLLKCPDMKDKYSETYIVALHNVLAGELQDNYRDGEGALPAQIQSLASFKLAERKQIEYSVEISQANQLFKVKRYPIKLHNPTDERSDQFLFRWSGNVSVLPGELLVDRDYFTIDELQAWKIDVHCTLAQG